MANTTTPASYITVDPQADECRENVPPRDPKADDSSKLENTENFTLHLQKDGMNALVSSTPALKNKSSDFQAKSLLSGIQYSKSPVSENLNIWNKSGSPEPFKLRSSPNLAVPSSFYAANCQKSTEDSRTQKNGEDVSMINDECLPEVTLFDITSDSMIHPTTNDSVFPDRRHATPQLYGKRSKSSDNQNSFCTKVGESFQSALSFQGFFNDYLQDISLLEVTQDSPVGHMSFLDMEDVRTTSDHNDKIMTEKSDTITIEDVSSTSRNSAQSSRQNSIKSTLEVTQDVTLENSKSSFESSGQKVEKSQNPDNGTQVINITRDLCSSCDASKTVNISSSGIEISTHEVCPEAGGNPDCIEAEMVRKESQQSSESETSGQKLEIYQSSGTHCIQAINITQEKNPGFDTSVQTSHLSSDMDKFTSGLESEPKEKPEELPTCCDTESTNKESQQTLKPDVSANGTFAVEQSSIQTVSFVKNKTLDLLPTNVSKAKDVEESRDQQTSVDSKTEASFVVHQSSSDEKETTFAVAQNATVNGDVLQKSKLQIGSTLENTPAPLSHQNDTFDYKLPSQLNGTITLAEISSNDSHQSGLGSSSTSKARNATTTLKDDCSENNSSKLQTNEAAEPETKKGGSPNMTFETAEPETKKDGSPNMTFETAEPETKKDGSPNMTFETAEAETTKDGSPNMTFETAEPETKKDGSPNMTFETAEPETKKDGSPNMTFETAEPETKKDGSPNVTDEAAEPETTKDGSPNSTNENAEPETKKDGSPNMTFETAEPETKKDGSPNMTFETAKPETKKDGSPNVTFETAEPETKKDGSPNVTDEAAQPETTKDGSPNSTNETAEPETKKDGSPNVTNEAAEPETTKDGSPNMTFETAEPETKKDGSPNLTNEAAEPETTKDGSPNKTFETAEPENKNDGSPNMTFEAPLQPANVSIYLSQSGLSDFDESLDLGPQCLATSTPMVGIKLFPSETKREAGHILTMQKELYGKTPIEPSNTIKPLNLISDRKTFFKQPTAKILHPASKIASELLKRNPPAMSTGLPVKLQRPDGESAKSSAAPKEQEKNSSLYNLRSLASKLKPPSGLQRPQVSGIPTGLPRAAQSLRAAPCSSTEKLSGPAAANAVMKMAPGKRHPLAKGDTLPVSKRKKTDASTTEAPAASGLKPGKQPTAGHRSAPDKSSRTGAAAAKIAASHDAVSRGKGLKLLAANPRAVFNRVKPQSHGCIKCEHLSQENERLKEVLRKHKIPLNG